MPWSSEDVFHTAGSSSIPARHRDQPPVGHHSEIREGSQMRKQNFYINAPCPVRHRSLAPQVRHTSARALVASLLLLAQQ